MKIIKLRMNAGGLANYEKIDQCEIRQEINDHGYMTLSGELEEEEVSAAKALMYSENEISVEGVDIDGQSETLFVGIIYNGGVETNGDYNRLSLTLVTPTRKMEGVEKTKTFQTGATTYSTLFSNLQSTYNTKAELNVSDSSIGSMIVQYKENDWQFALRLASNLNTSIYPAINKSGGHYYVGIKKQGSAKSISYKNLKIKQSVNEYQVSKSRNVPLSKVDSLSYEFESREYYPIGTAISLEGCQKQLYVYANTSKFEQAELVNSYVLRTEGGFKQIKKYNGVITGASLAGKVTSIAGDKVKVSLDTDSEYGNGDCGSKEFSYSTVYSSPDGTGWYCMPEQGDRVRLYFPSEKEEEAYVISSVHVDSTSGEETGLSVSSGDSGAAAPRSNPDIKSISNKQNKEIIFAPTTLTITNNNGLSIVLDDENGITIESDKGVYICAEESIEVISNDSLVVASATSLELEQEEQNTITLQDGEITFDSGKLLLQQKG